MSDSATTTERRTRRRPGAGSRARPTPGSPAAVAMAGLAAVAVAGAAVAGAAATAAGSERERPGRDPASRPESVRPVPGEVTAGFDPPAHPYGPGRRGVRLAADGEEAVRAVRAGEVAFVGPVAGTPWVSVEHGGGLRTTYGPVAPEVGAGEQVAAGDVVGRLADGGEGLHWGAKVDGAYVDPLDLLRRWRPVLRPRPEQPG